MNPFKKAANKVIGKVVNAVTNSVSQVSAGGESAAFEPSDSMKALCRTAGAEGVVLLKNEKDTLPLTPDRRVSVFGRVQRDYFYVGYGSGGDVNAPYKVSPLTAMRACPGITLNESLAAVYEAWCEKHPVDDGYWGHWPMCYEEMPLTRAQAQAAADVSDTALVFIGRAAGEDRENKLTKGSYYLTDAETRMLDAVTAEFDRVAVLLDCGSIMDMAQLAAYGDKITAILYVWQSGMESGNAICDVLTGAVSPCGKLTDTIGRDYADWLSSRNFGGKKFNVYAEDIYVGYRGFETFAPERVLYPFGFGLSYTTFDVRAQACLVVNDTAALSVRVENTGKTPGKEVAQVYFSAPNGRLGKPARVLCAFRKTRLLFPGEAEELTFSVPLADLASYDDETTFSWLLEAGHYDFYVGTDVRSAVCCGGFDLPAERVTARLQQTAAPTAPFLRLKRGADGSAQYVPVPLAQYDLRAIIRAQLPAATPAVGSDHTLTDVKNGLLTVEQLAAELTDDELEAISRGDYIMNSPLGPTGNAGAFGGVLDSLRRRGIPPVITTDGPSGIRLRAASSLLPVGTGLACTWDPALAEALYAEVGREMLARGSDVLLAPGMNLHRNPLCGRNFEYFSEDPLLTGCMAAGVVRGLQRTGVSACVKHFACNNQEVNRTHNDSRVSERALRELYLKGFEICVKTAAPQNLMTSYNLINGVWGHYHYELCTRILRGEWGYRGNIMTDWWMRSSASPEFPALRDQAYRVRAGVNVLMPGGGRMGRRRPDGTLLQTRGMPDGITRGELEQNAAQVLRFAMQSSAFKKQQKEAAE
ncbi:MAG: glycoside hydrolase family 3 protein [Clostridia bacterium]|nr:glycoside hydrolase family 3 protein [Clostridia bacterium]